MAAVVSSEQLLVTLSWQFESYDVKLPECWQVCDER